MHATSCRAHGVVHRLPPPRRPRRGPCRRCVRVRRVRRTARAARGCAGRSRWRDLRPCTSLR